jgi:NDP-sugar pyrophosphorylase family protein
MPAIAVLAGGLGTRMGPLTQKVPKALLEVAGEPFIAHQLRLFRREAIERVVVCAGHLGEAIEDLIGDGRDFGLEVAYSYDGDRLLGTGGALRRALPLLGPEFLVIYGDSYLDIAFQPLVDKFRAAGTLGLMAIFHNAGQWDTSNVEFHGGRIVEYSKQPTPKMHYIDYGLAVLGAQAFDGTPASEPFDLSFVYRRLIEGSQMTGFEVTSRFFEIGSPQGLADTATYILAQQQKAQS